MSETLEAPARAGVRQLRRRRVAAEPRPAETYEKRSPWRPAETIGEFPASGEEDVDAAVEAAAAAFPEWSTPPGAAARADPERGRGRDRAPRRADRRRT